MDTQHKEKMVKALTECRLFPKELIAACASIDDWDILQIWMKMKMPGKSFTIVAGDYSISVPSMVATVILPKIIKPTFDEPIDPFLDDDGMKNL